MTRCKHLIAILAVLIAATAFATTIAAPPASASSSLRGKLHHAKRELRRSHHRLTNARAALAAALAAAAAAETVTPTPTPTPTATGTATPDAAGDAGTVTTDPAADAATDPAALAAAVERAKARVTHARHKVRLWRQRVRRLAKRYRQQRRMASWEAHGHWKPIIRIAAAKYHVKAAGMYRMMMRESGGRRFAGASTAFKGLFQYHTGTWAASWNPYRHDSIYDGSSQIFATAYAIHKGMGPSMWTTTWASQY